MKWCDCVDACACRSFQPSHGRRPTHIHTRNPAGRFVGSVKQMSHWSKCDDDWWGRRVKSMSKMLEEDRELKKKPLYRDKLRSFGYYLQHNVSWTIHTSQYERKTKLVDKQKRTFDTRHQYLNGKQSKCIIGKRKLHKSNFEIRIIRLSHLMFAIRNDSYLLQTRQEKKSVSFVSFLSFPITESVSVFDVQWWFSLSTNTTKWSENYWVLCAERTAACNINW